MAQLGEHSSQEAIDLPRWYVDARLRCTCSTSHVVLLPTLEGLQLGLRVTKSYASGYISYRTWEVEERSSAFLDKSKTNFHIILPYF